MPEYIERAAVINHLRERAGTPPEIAYTYPTFKAIERFVEELPAADLAKVVRCRECKQTVPLGFGVVRCKLHGKVCKGESFCSWGERKEDVNA